MGAPRFTWEINFANVLGMVGMFAGALLAYGQLRADLRVFEERTAFYTSTVGNQATALSSLASRITVLEQNHAVRAEQLNVMRADISRLQEQANNDGI